jgi:S1-C subfamily serine protease
MSYSGTGFLVSSDGDVLTNRHIAEPWWADPEAQRIVAAGYRPEMKSLRAYFPGRGIKYNLKTVLTSKQADVALLQVDPVRNLPAPLVLGPPAERAAPGSRVLLIGYPAGLGPILGRLNRAQLDRVPEYLNFTEQQMTQALASKALIEPFVSFGYLSNVKGEVLTLSAQTSEGSSGSPVLNEQGEVIAIHSAALTRVAGGSLAVPVEAARELITHRGGANRSQGGSSFTRWRNPHSGR